MSLDGLQMRKREDRFLVVEWVHLTFLQDGPVRDRIMHGCMKVFLSLQLKFLTSLVEQDG